MDHEEGLKGRTALVTGAGRGIGRGIAEVLAARGCDVVVNDVREDAIDEAVEAVNDAGTGRVGGIQADVADADAVAGMFEAAADELAVPDVLVNNAGVVRAESFDEVSATSWREVLSVNLDGVANCCRASVPYWDPDDGGVIVNIASTAGLRISPLAGAHYTSSKWGVIGLTKHLAHELAPRGIRVNAVCPGPTRSPAVANLTDKGERDALASESIPLGRWGTPGDIGRTVAFLASPQAGYITGAAVPVDGGYSIL